MTMIRLVLSCGLLILLLSTTAEAANHEHLGDVRCIDCHAYLPLNNVPPPPFQEGIVAVCRQCHGEHGCLSSDMGGVFVHPIEIMPSQPIPADMPLDRHGRMTCITCHYFHPYKGKKQQTLSMLRRQPGKTFCFYCHEKL